jgi:ketosteroid isomerase-like protein
MSTVDEVREASKKFYAALNRMANGEKDAPAAAWLNNGSVTAMHPIGGREVGWNAVNVSFNQVAQAASDGKIELKDQLIQDLGNVAYEVGIEKVQFKLAGHEVKDEARVTNIYKKEGGSWKMVHHHTDLSPSMIDVLKKLQSK